MIGTGKIFAERLLALRIEKGISQGELGDAVDLSRGSISYYENALRVADAEAIANIARYFDVSADYLLGLSDARKLHRIIINKKSRCANADGEK